MRENELDEKSQTKQINIKYSFKCSRFAARVGKGRDEKTSSRANFRATPVILLKYHPLFADYNTVHSR